MRIILLLLCACAAAYNGHTQDLSNKGKEFWIGYGDHVGMHGGAPQKMSLYITSDVNTTGQVEIAGIGSFIPFTITANRVTVVPIPLAAQLNAEGLFNRGIRVIADRPVVVYAHIFANSVSGATLCLPTNTLGREYVSINYRQASNEPTRSFSYVFVVATEDNTTVEIVPSVNTQGGWAANSINTVVLNRGQVYQVLAHAEQDLTGTTIRSVSGTGAGCKRIAVYSGSGKISIGCGRNDNEEMSSDNLFQQVYPTAAWGKKYIAVSSKNEQSRDQRNFYRIVKSKPSAVVKLNGSNVPQAAFTNSLYYDFDGNGTHVIESTEPVQVAQYFTTQRCAGNVGAGDPEMIFLNPIEQTISNVTLYSSPDHLITYHGLNIVVRNTGSALTSMKLDGASIGHLFEPLFQDADYSFARIEVSAGTHNLVSDSGFNVIAYGFGNAESYGYSAGTNLKDLYQFITIQNDYSTVNFPAGCKNTPFRFAMTFPYQPTQIKWVFGKELNDFGINDTTINTPVHDSSWMVNGRTLYRYRLERYSSIPTPGSYTVSVFANNPTADGCTGEQEIEYDLQIFDQPKAGMSYTHTGCLSDSVAFIDNTDGLGRLLVSWNWDFGNGETSTVRNPKYKYATAGTYTVKHWAITDIGCISDTVPQQIVISNPPVASFAVSNSTCEKATVTFTDQSNAAGSTIVKWTWNFGDASAPVITSNADPVSHSYQVAGTYTVTLTVETNSGCKSELFSYPLVITPKPKADFVLPAGICLPNGTAQFTDQSTIADGTQSQFTYAWDFGDGNISNQKDPVHNYSGVGPFNVKLTVTSANGCVHDTTKLLSTIFAQPQANFSAPAEVCLSDSATFTDQSAAANSTITQWFWDFGDNTTSNAQHPKKKWDVSGPYTVTLYTRSAAGCISNTITKQVIANPLPEADFNFSNPTCETRSVTFTDGSAANAGSITKWNWNFGDAGTSTQQSPQHTYAAPGTYSVSLDVETSKGCKSTIGTKPIVINSLPAPDFSLPDVCSADAFAEFTDLTTIADASENQFTYLWNFGDPNANAGNPNTSAVKNGRHRYSVAGLYTVRLTVTSKDGCSQFIDKEFTVNGSLPNSVFTVNNSSDLCSNKDVTITDASSVDVGRLIRVEIYWDYLNDPTQKTVDENPAAGKTYTHKYPEFGTPLTKTYQVRYVVYSGITCLNQSTATVALKASPGLQFDAMAGVCEEIAPFQFISARETFGLDGNGVFSGNGITPSGMFTPRDAKPGLHTIRYTFNADNGCSAFTEQTIRVNPTPVVNAGPDRVVLEGGYIVLDAKSTGSNLSYQWSPSLGLNNTRVLNPQSAPPGDLEYLLTVTSGDGCVGSDRVKVTLLKEIQVPNAFSPNNDGTNDTWRILYLDSYPGCEVEVYNRYGQPVFRSVGYNTPWDGKFKGADLPVGTYYWIITPKNGRRPIHGSVTIIR